MIDSTTSPVPAWKRYAMIVGLALLVVVAAYVIYTKELHHSTGSPGSSASQGAVVAPAPAVAGASPTAPVTTVPAAVPVSSRDPFGA